MSNYNCVPINIYYSVYMYMYVCVCACVHAHTCMLSCVWLFVTLWTIACWTRLSMEFPRKEYWNGLPFPSSGDCPDRGIKSTSPALQVDSIPLRHQGSPCVCVWLFSSVQFSCLVVSDSLWPHELEHARLSCPSLTPRAYSNSCPMSQWCHPTISPCHLPPALNFLWHQGHFKWVSSSH